jgi:hypothetical protein
MPQNLGYSCNLKKLPPSKHSPNWRKFAQSGHPGWRILTVRNFDAFSIARRLGLKSKSFGKNEDRFLTISRKLSSRDILRQLMANGGSSEKYDLIPPNSG